MGRLDRTGVDRTKRIVREQIESGLEFTAIRARELAERQLSTAYPPASTPGEFPHRRTGQLVDSLRHGLDAENLESYMGVSDSEPQYPPNRHAGGRHWVWLMNAGRLGLEEVVIAGRDDLIDAFNEGVASVKEF